MVRSGSSLCTDGSKGSPCFFGEDCENEICAFENAGPGSPGFCSCNSDTGAGCEDGFVCYTSEEYGSAQGFAITTSNSCLLALGSACDPQRTECLSAVCDMVTNLCACNSFTNFGCDAENGEVCNVRDGLYACEVPMTSPGADGDDCFEDNDCETLSCVFDPPAPAVPDVVLVTQPHKRVAREITFVLLQATLEQRLVLSCRSRRFASYQLVPFVTLTRMTV